MGLRQNKCIIFSHNDLDGAGCVIISKLFFNTVSYRICNYGNVDKKVIDFVTDVENQNDLFDYLFITDISVKPETIEIINNSPYKDRYYIIDHHESVKQLNDGKRIFIIPENNSGILNCGTSLFFEFLYKYLGFNFINQSLASYQIDVLNYTRIVRDYDTWMWKEKNNQEAIKENLLFKIVGYYEYVNLKVNTFKKQVSDSMINLLDKMIDNESSKIKSYLENSKFSNTYTDDNGYKFVINFSEQYINDVADYYNDNHPENDYIIIINMKNMTGSLRTHKDNIDLSKIAKERYGGGGHPKASGFSIEGKEDIIQKLADIVNKAISNI